MGGPNPNPFVLVTTATTLPGNMWAPADNGLLVANMDPFEAASTQTVTAGSNYLFKINIRSAITATNILFVITTAGAGASTGSFVGLYNSAGSLLSGSADNGGSLVGTGTITTPLTTPQALAAGTFVWAAVLVNLATTQPTLAKSASAVSVSNFNLSNALSRTAINGTAITTLPASITPASNAQGSSFAALIGIS